MKKRIKICIPTIFRLLKKTKLVLIYFHLGHNEIRFTSRAQGNYYTLLKDKP